jgi:hypothetical protein
MTGTRSRLTAAALASIFGIGSAVAGPKDEKIRAVMVEAVSKWTPALTCSVLNPQMAAETRAFWDKERAAVTPMLLAAKVAPDLISDIANMTDPKAMMQRTEGSAADLIRFCNENKAWFRDLQLFTIPLPSLEVQKILGK